MIRIIGDRKENTLDEMEEVARARNADVAEEERLEKLEAARRAREEAERKEKGIPEAPAGNIIIPNYHGLEWELHAPRVGQRKVKELYSYNDSLERLKKEGKRHPLPSEAFSLITDYFKGNLSGDLKEVADDMLSAPGEWLSMAFLKRGTGLMLYSHPEGLVWNGTKYEMGPDFKYSQVLEYYIGKLESEKWLSLRAFQKAFVDFMYGETFTELPQEIQLRAGIYLPPQGEIYPIARCDVNLGITYESSVDSASRGVKEIADVPPHTVRTGPPGSINYFINQAIEQIEKEGRTK